ncbi:MAG: hypothetical protein MK161_06335 [Pirellulales bacterium]|nr:hypothetical protein [Pirellulales bacterium]
MASIFVTAAIILSILTSGHVWANIGTARLWYAAPLIVSISLVYAATRHEEIGPILVHAARFAVWIIGFMLIVLVVLQAMVWLM